MNFPRARTRRNYDRVRQDIWVGSVRGVCWAGNTSSVIMHHIWESERLEHISHSRQRKRPNLLRSSEIRARSTLTLQHVLWDRIFGFAVTRKKIQ